MTVSSIWLRPPPVLQGLGNDLRLVPPMPGRRVGIRAGEDARISVERARERRLNIEGRNLNADLDVVAPKPPVNARI